MVGSEARSARGVPRRWLLKGFAVASGAVSAMGTPIRFFGKWLGYGTHRYGAGDYGG